MGMVMGEVYTLPSEIARLIRSYRRRHKLVCPVCGQEFEGETGRKYCSRRCANRAASRGYRQRNLEKIRARQRERYHRLKASPTTGPGQAGPENGPPSDRP